MYVAIRRMIRPLGKLAAGLAVANRALGALVPDLEEVVPVLAANNVVDQRLELIDAIMILFAGSLTILFLGYVAESTRPVDRI